LVLYADGFENSEAIRRAESEAQLKRSAEQLRTKTHSIFMDRVNCPYSPIQSRPTNVDPIGYKSSSPHNFVVLGKVPSAEPHYAMYEKKEFYMIRLDDGAIGYIGDYYFNMDKAYSSDEKSLREKCIFDVPMQNVLESIRKIDAEQREASAARQKKQRDEAESSSRYWAERRAEEEEAEKKRAAIAKRPGVRIGMTAKQVIEKSSWGQPDSVNKTVSQFGVDEQWVYDSGDYLYFHNGRLTAIQN
jgi:hypothetical protein